MRPRLVSRLALLLWAVSMTASALTIVLLVLNRFYQPPGSYGFAGSDLLLAAGFATVGLVIGTRRPENVVGWLFGSMGIGAAASEFTRQYAVRAVLLHPGSLPAGEVVAWLQTGVVFLPTAIALPLVFLLFPDGRFLSRRWRAIAWVGIAGVTAGHAAFALMPGPLDGIPQIENPFGVGANRGPWQTVVTVGFGSFAASLLTGLGSLVVRFRRSRADERQQLKWLGLAAALFGAVFVAALVPFVLGGPIPPWVDLLLTASFVMIAAGAAVAVLKYRLYEIDLVINRALVFGSLAAIVTLLYLGIVVGLGALIGRGGNVVLSVLATAVIAVGFQPLRQILQGLVNRLVYGQRATPYEAMSAFSHQMSGALSLDEVLPRMAEAAAAGVAASNAHVRVFLPDGLERSATWPAGVLIEHFDRVVPVIHQEKQVGEIGVTKPRGEAINPTEQKLLDDLASQAGLALRNVALTLELQARLDQISSQAAELRASRQRLVRAQDQERRRIERNLHDGAQQQLVALKVKLGLAKRLASADERLEDLLLQLEREADETVESLRDLARGIYPPLLAERGLAEALAAQALRAALPVEIAADEFPRLSEEAEMAVYFCCLEALQNVAKYARASKAVVGLSVDGDLLRFSIADDGAGFEPERTKKGSGTQNMVDRIEALGGSIEIRSSPGQGTTILGTLPLIYRGA